MEGMPWLIGINVYIITSQETTLDAGYLRILSLPVKFLGLLKAESHQIKGTQITWTEKNVHGHS